MSWQAINNEQAGLGQPSKYTETKKEIRLWFCYLISFLSKQESHSNFNYEAYLNFSEGLLGRRNLEVIKIRVPTRPHDVGRLNFLFSWIQCQILNCDEELRFNVSYYTFNTFTSLENITCCNPKTMLFLSATNTHCKKKIFSESRNLFPHIRMIMRETKLICQNCCHVLGLSWLIIRDYGFDE